jgi:hypothetical protein
MPYDLTRLASYVRFYLTVRRQLVAAWENLARSHGVVKDGLSPFGEALGPVGSPALAAALGPPPRAEGIDALFLPEDEEGLAGLNDVYEVVGHFSFQGAENANLARVQALVSGARNEIVAQRMRLADLARLPEIARAAAARLAAGEEGRAGALRAEKAAAFEPLADQVQTRARQTMEAIRAVPFPDLASADSAGDDYKRFTAKLDQVYQTCLPFLRKSIGALYAFVGCEPTATWPDALPLTRELPAELLMVPPAGSAELTQARASLEALANEEVQLGRARDDVATAIARLEGELGAAGVRDKELEVEIATATQIVDYVTAIESAGRAQQTLAALDQQKARILRAAGDVLSKHKQIEASLKMLDEELVRRTAEIEATAQVLTAERKDEPVLFGKDDWRARVAGFEGQVEAQRVAYTERLTVVSRLKIDLSSVSVEVQTEQQQAALVDRQIADVRATLEATQKSMAALSASLGAQRPARPVAVAEAREGLAALQQARLDNAQRGERLRGEIRRQKEETVRVLARLKQCGVERQQVQTRVQSAQVAATEGHEEALRHLAAQRRAAVERHVGEVLGTLEKSLTMVGPVFVEPARKAMLESTAPQPEAAERVLAAAEKAAPVLEKLGRELDAQLLAQDAALGQIQREFCDVAVTACRAAWG